MVSSTAEELVADGAVEVDEALRVSGVGRSVLYERMAAGELPFVKVGRRRLIPRRALAQFLARHLVTSATR